MTKPVFVIGSNSFSGSAFCEHLLAQDIEVIGISRSQEPIKELLPHKLNGNKPLQFHQLDLNHHLERIESLIDKFKPSHIYNFAAQSMVGQSWDFPEHWFMTNTVSTIKLHNILRQKDYLERYIHISTPEVYGTTNGEQLESKIYQPSTPYATSRAAADMSLHNFFDVYQFPVIFTRAANVYGAGQQLYRIIPRTILYALTGRQLALHGGGFSERSFIDISDVSKATQLIGENGRLGDIYHISTNELVSIRELVSLICKKLNKNFDLVVKETGDRKGKDHAYWLNSEKLRNELGWSDVIDLESGIDSCIDWITRNLEVLNLQPLEYIHKA
ncbi:GDP-mannose 4,6-dehydratase [Thalassotalea marina]|uniref:NAD(P)-binding domain-containing protein n=1 Tax=Thalassotalea marina TaxID=1673741 RepID=A0A919BCM1_9GAMM|nr:GDP-mannose 4,6-dehydratase [Thalassotalea marina]GHF80440.1 hypothetical protein GCM10017161_04660 [Thalassotalea marina]